MPVQSSRLDADKNLKDTFANGKRFLLIKYLLPGILLVVSQPSVNIPLVLCACDISTLLDPQPLIYMATNQC